MSKRQSPLPLEQRRALILEAALNLAEIKHYRIISRSEIAEVAGVAPSTVSHAFTDMQSLRDALMQAAVDAEIPKIVADGIATGDPIAKNAPSRVYNLAVAHMLK